MKQIARAATALAATALVGLGIAVVPVSPASATDWDEWMYTDDGDPGGRVEFERTGDVMRVCDIEADGYAVLLNVVDYTSGKFKYEQQVGGNGNCLVLRASLGDPYNLAEQHVFWVRIALVQSDRVWHYQDEAYWFNNA